MRRIGAILGLLAGALLASTSAVGAQDLTPTTTAPVATTAPAGTTTTTTPVPAACAAAAAAAAAGQAELAVKQYLAAAEVAATQACALAGLQALGAGEKDPADACIGPAALLAAGNTADARAGYVAVLKEPKAPDCAATGLKAVAVAEVTAACRQGDELREKGALESAGKAYETAVQTASSTGVTATCATTGLDAIREENASSAPASLGRMFAQIVKFLLTGLWIVVLLVIGVALILCLLGWLLRGAQRVFPNRDLPTLVPRLRVEKVGMSEDAGTGDGVTNLLRGQLRSTQGASPQLQVGDASSSTIVAAIKDFDPKLAAVAALAAECRRLNPWPSLSVATQQLKKAKNGTGLSLSIVHGSREPAAATLWRHPVAPEPTSIQQTYELLPAAATWILVESTLVTAPRSDPRSPEQVVSSAYAESARRLALGGDVASALALYQQALRLDGENLFAQLEIQNLDPTEKPLDERPKAVRDPLDIAYRHQALHPAATSGQPWRIGA